MTADDIALGMRLKEQAGWNQTEADWQRFLLVEPDGCFLAELNGEAVGTTVTCTFGSVAWIAMVLVDVRLRRRGIATALMTHALAHLEKRGVTCIRLDATPLGRPVYEKLGFVAQYELARFQGVLPPAGPVAGVEPVPPQRFHEVVNLDRAVSGTDRTKLLARLFQEHPETIRGAWTDGTLQGYLAIRPRAHALQLGPCMANEEAGSLLMHDAWCRCAGKPVVVDVPTRHTPATRLVEGMGLTVQRHLLRMGRGASVAERIDALWSSSGPEKG
jgi:GNAT superfamily N-acetyltransferase